MNHPMGEESTGVGESCSLTYHLSSTSSVLRQSEPRQTAAGADIYKGRDLCGGFRPFSLREGEPGAAVFVGRAQRDAPDRPDRNDQLVDLIRVLGMHGEGQKAVARLARERLQGQSLAVCKFDLPLRALGRVARRVALDLAMHACDEVVQRRLRGARNPQLLHRRSLPRSIAPSSTEEERRWRPGP